MPSGIGLPELLFVVTIALGVVLVLLSSCRICAKAGYPAWLGVAAILPVANLLLLLFLGFST